MEDQTIQTPIQEITPGPVLTPNFSKNRKIIITILGVLFLLFVAIYLFYQSSNYGIPKPSDPSISIENWGTYTNSNFSFEIKYKDWITQPQEEINDNSIFIYFTYNYGSRNQNNGHVAIRVSNLNLEQATNEKKMIYEQNYPEKKLLEETTVEISGVKGIRLHYQNVSKINNFTDYIILSRGPITYTLKSPQGDLVVFNQILSTFKFLDSLPITVEDYISSLPTGKELIDGTQNL